MTTVLDNRIPYGLVKANAAARRSAVNPKDPQGARSSHGEVGGGTENSAVVSRNEKGLWPQRRQTKNHKPTVSPTEVGDLIMVAVASLEWQDVMDGNFSEHSTRQTWRQAVMEVAERAKTALP